MTPDPSKEPDASAGRPFAGTRLPGPRDALHFQAPDPDAVTTAREKRPLTRKKALDGRYRVFMSHEAKQLDSSRERFHPATVKQQAILYYLFPCLMWCSPSAWIVSLDYQSPHKSIGTSYSPFPPGVCLCCSLLSESHTLVSRSDWSLRS